MGEGLSILDLFSGAGGLGYGLEQSGVGHVVAHCEIDPHNQRILKARHPEAYIHDDVRTLTAAVLHERGIYPDAIAAGFPCQDASIANQSGQGTLGERTGLFVHVVRLARDLGCKVIFMENVPELLNRGFGDVLGALAEIRFDAEWEVISASAMGAPHKRERLYIVAYPSGQGWQGSEPDNSIFGRAFKAFPEYGHTAFDAWGYLDASVELVRDCDGLSVGMERRRLYALGNAVVPQIPELLGRAYLSAIGEAA
ncbi:DNA cytosine methyltransferase [Hyphomonas sp. CY54-11-8]|uniref:DNA cytosine methyltransferase n=1 Tax=Hyphomonas sp. CY54-11-8 TaxID=1280944 RepID=UPI000458B52D|nr:DNA (cytosine-5-)-methyltransferase [Hyphomonas sp. CY54-11-8]KCZ47561.1 DNA methyltransferase [Hyphomonas sp. CY54-11-8]